MAVRNGMLTLISKVRFLSQESGTSILTDDNIQTLLDNNQTSFIDDQLLFNPHLLNGSVIYTQYKSQNANLEGTASGTSVVRVINSGGTIVTNFTQSDNIFTFDSNQAGTAYYLTGYSYNLNQAIADCWRIKAGYYSNQFDFKIEGREFKQSQLVNQCLRMAEQFEQESSQQSVQFISLDESGWLR